MNSNKGGPGRGQGRKALKPGESTRSVSIWMAASQAKKLHALGGAPWVREQIDTASLPETAGDTNRPTMGHYKKTEIEMEFGVLYLPSGWQRECADEAQARDAFEHAPQGDGETAVLIINGEESQMREPD